MAEKTKKSIDIDAPPDKVMEVIADLGSYPEWVSAAKSVEILESYPDGRPAGARFVLDKGPIKDNYELAYEWAPDGKSVKWHLVRGSLQKAQDGEYRLVDAPGGGTSVTYELTVDVNMPMIGMFKRKAEKIITDIALNELKKRVEG